jgi:ubiquitin C-terminal hydrolase
MNKPIGILNLGNTCFINSCLQVLLQTTELMNLPENPTTTDSIEIDMYKAWKELQTVFQKNSELNINVINPNKLIFFIQKIAEKKRINIFSGFSQNDITEFLLFFIESIHECIRVKIHATLHGMIENETDELAKQCYEMMIQKCNLDYSMMIDLFYGISVSQLSSIDTMERLTSNPESFFVLDLPMNGSTIYDCFDKYISSELLENENAWWNENTGYRIPVYKNTKIWKFPNILIISLNRITVVENKYVKNTIPIEFPIHNLDLSKYVCGYFASTYHYELYGICNHIGNITEGHYTSFVKTPSNEWYHCNDNRIDIVQNVSGMITPAAYCLFYRKKNN